MGENLLSQLFTCDNAYTAATASTSSPLLLETGLDIVIDIAYTYSASSPYIVALPLRTLLALRSIFPLIVSMDATEYNPKQDEHRRNNKFHYSS